MNIICTKELEAKIKKEYDRIKETAEQEGIYADVEIVFGKKSPAEYEGPYAYADEEGYHYVVSERGKIVEHKITDDLFEISYWILQSEVFQIALNFEVRNRMKSQDIRKLLFEKKLELLDKIGKNYRKREEIRIDEILKANPYNDDKFN